MQGRHPSGVSIAQRGCVCKMCKCNHPSKYPSNKRRQGQVVKVQLQMFIQSVQDHSPKCQDFSVQGMCTSKPKEAPSPFMFKGANPSIYVKCPKHSNFQGIQGPCSSGCPRQQRVQGTTKGSNGINAQGRSVGVRASTQSLHPSATKVQPCAPFFSLCLWRNTPGTMPVQPYSH